MKRKYIQLYSEHFQQKINPKHQHLLSEGQKKQTKLVRGQYYGKKWFPFVRVTGNSSKNH